MAKNRSMHREITEPPLAYFITFRTYGTWLPGDERGAIDDRHNKYQSPRISPSLETETAARERMRDPEMLLAADSAFLVEQTIAEVCAHRHWHLRIVKARTNHVHTVVTASEVPEKVMNDFKSWSTRRLREHGFAHPTQKVWVEHGSTPYLWTDAQLLGAIEYARDWQGGPLQKTWDEVLLSIKAQEMKANAERARVGFSYLADATGSV